MSKAKSKVDSQEAAGTPEVSIISDEELQKELESRSARGKWQMIFKAINEDGQARKVSGLTRGQIAALYRAANVKGLGTKANMKSGTVIVFKK